MSYGAPDPVRITKDDLRDYENSVARELYLAGIAGDDRRARKLWERVGREGVEEVAASLNMGAIPAHFTRQMAFLALHEIDSERSWKTRAGKRAGIGRCGLEIAVLSAAVAVLSLGFVRNVGFRHAWVGDTPLLAYQIIQDADLKQARLFGIGGRKEVDSALVGHYVLRGASQWSRLRVDQVSRRALDEEEQRQLASRRVVSLPVSPHVLDLASPGTRLGLSFPPTGGQTSPGATVPQVEDAFVLDIQKDGHDAWMVVALEPADFELVARLARGSDAPRPLVWLSGEQLIPAPPRGDAPARGQQVRTGGGRPGGAPGTAASRRPAG